MKTFSTAAHKLSLTGERYITDSLDDYSIGPCPNCGSTIGHADLTRKEDWPSWSGGDADVPLLWIADGTLTCTSCEHKRHIEADVRSGSVQPVFASAKLVENL